MNIADDSSIDLIDDEELKDFDSEDSFSEKLLSSKRDVRAELEKKLEMLELRKLTGDSVYDELFD